MSGLLSGFKRKVSSTKDRIVKPYETREITEAAIISLLGKEGLAGREYGIRPDFDCSSVVNFTYPTSVIVNVRRDSVKDYLRRNGMGTSFLAFLKVLCEEVDKRMRVDGTYVDEGIMTNNVYRFNLHPGE